MQLFSNTHIDFIGKRRKFYLFSIAITLLGLVVALVRGVEMGIDFEGGAEADVRFPSAPDMGDVRAALEQAGFSGAEVKAGGENDVLIRVKNEGATVSGDSSIAAKIDAALESGFPDHEIREIRTVGPKIGREMRTQALLAVLASIIVILIYVTVRFEWVYGLGAIIALVHDVLVAFSFAVIFNGVFGLNLELNQSMLAALLTVVGFSINDTVIIFDRIRENKTKHKGENLMMLMNRSINETLPRTINTSLTVVLVLVVLLFFSGDTLQGFAFTMLIGVLVGAYSSIYIASSFVVDTMIRRGRLDKNAESKFAEHTIETRQRVAAARSASTPVK